ncbi:integrase [Sinorhizobium meliloti]|uniref:tyrosine-type recombinase/integrase n=1 Tax=Rhizobium meliloti TaxID=382 RepID=UPI000FDA4D81|nr:tyrosine-type recombinase/integrase [Sinorhizobium meliloti]RVI63891.1 integrase [Sinorhizobium meliloti]
MSLLSTYDPVKAFPLIGRADAATRHCFLEFFAVSVPNENTRKAYLSASGNFLSWIEGIGLASLSHIQPFHVAAWVVFLSKSYSTASVKQKLAAVKMLFDWLVRGQIIPVNPCTSVKGPKYSVRKGKTPVLTSSEARQLLLCIDASTVAGLRDRALIGTMVFTFARIGAVLSMHTDDVYLQSRRLWIRLREKGGKIHDMPCHHELEDWLSEYLAVAQPPCGASAWLYRSIDKHSKVLSDRSLEHANAYAMVKRRAKQAGIETCVTNHTFRATGITDYLSNGGTLERAAKMANHASTRTTQLYDRRDDGIILGEVERIRL